MPVFYFLVVLGIVLIWFLIAFLYKPIGKFFRKIIMDSVDAMTEEDENDKKEKDNA